MECEVRLIRVDDVLVNAVMNKVIDYLKAEGTEAVSELNRMFGEEAVTEAAQREEVYPFQHKDITGLSYMVDVSEQNHIDSVEI